MSASWRIIEGDALDRLRELSDRSVQTCITSPPYFGLRDYGVEGQIGLEATPDDFADALIAVFREVRRVLRDDGTLWLNIGDSYWSAKGTPGGERAWREGRNGDAKQPARRFGARPQDPAPAGIKRKDLIGIPWMLAFALRADGWYLRRDIIWSKPNPMPESVRDRPTCSHEYLFLLSKSPRYYYDAEAVREDGVWPGQNRADRSPVDSHVPGAAPHAGLRQDKQVSLGRNKRSVWTIATRPFAEAHFATFPPDLVEPCVLAGSPTSACATCGRPYARVLGEGQLDESRPQARRAMEFAREHGLRDQHFEAIRAAGISDAGKALITTRGAGRNADDVQRLADEAREVLGGYYREFLLARPVTVGWEPACDHDDAGAPLVLDPFAGAGTTGLVALRHGRSFVGIELNPEYAAMARRRIHDDAPLLNGAAELPEAA